jgi:hypothetical protein
MFTKPASAIANSKQSTNFSSCFEMSIYFEVQKCILPQLQNLMIKMSITESSFTLAKFAAKNTSIT